MKSKNYFALMATAMLCCFACEKESYMDYGECSAPQQELCFSVEPTEIDFELDEESLPSDMVTRSYLDANSSTWNIRWQTGDQVACYLGHMNGSKWTKYSSQLATFKMTSATAGTISFIADDNMVANDYVLSNYSTDGVLYESVKNVVFNIPAEQYTSYQSLEFAKKVDGGYETSYSAEPALVAVANAMPRMGAPLKVTSAMIAGEKSTFGSISYKALGSILEARIYSSNSTIGVGETVQYVTLTSTDGTQLAGSFTRTLESATNLGASGITGSDCVTSHVEDCDYVVANSQTGYVPVDMVLAPGTFPATLTVVTDQYRYTIDFASKVYSVGVRKATYVNLSAATREPVNYIPDFYVTSSLTNCAFSYISGEAVQPNGYFMALVMPRTGYELTDDNVSITMGGQDITSSALDKATGMITISNVTGDIVIIINATEIQRTPTYYIDDQLSYCRFDGPISRHVEEGQPFEATVVPVSDDYQLESISVTMGGVDITEDVVAFDSFIYIPEVTGYVQITATASKIETDQID